ncbi:MAG: electron transport complex subunit RsxC [Gammaproteobacteria bacterium]|nr:electron transport complex subunit RsxC [Gammaproteobacteria bacterium]
MDSIQYTTQYQFHGGIHPEEHKELSNQHSIGELGVPPQLNIYLGQHNGQPALPVVNVGDYVKRGQLIGRMQGNLSANVHASSSGTVKEIALRPVAHASGMNDLCVVIDTDGNDASEYLEPIADYASVNKQVLLDRVAEAGIVGLGGAAFPSNIKLMPRVNHLIINAAECEPYISCDDRLMRENADELINAIQCVQSIIGAQHCTIGIEDNKQEAINALLLAIEKQDPNNNSHFQICVVPTKYPSGGEKQLIELITGKQVPAQQLPLALGIIMHNVATALAVYRAITKGEVLTQRLMTITGKAATIRGNFWTRIGTPFDWILEQAKVNTQVLDRVIMGGPMMGFEIQKLDSGTVKSTNCTIFAETNELATSNNSLPCIRCGLCADACPVSLLPQQLYWHSKSEEFNKAEHYNLFDCIECGACSYVCPSNIPLVQYYRFAKNEIVRQSDEKAKASHARERHEFRELRLQREKAERAERHRKAAEARKKAAMQKGEADEKKATIADAVARAKARKQQSKD